MTNDDRYWYLCTRRVFAKTAVFIFVSVNIGVYDIRYPSLSLG